MCDEDDKYYEATDGTRFYQYNLEYADVDYQNISSSGNISDRVGWNTQLNVKSLFLGISKTKVNNYIVETVHGIHSEVNATTTYADIFYAPSMILDPILYFASTTPVSTSSQLNARSYIGDMPKTYDVAGKSKNAVQLIPFGIRLGIESHTLHPIKVGKWKNSTTQKIKKISLGKKWELGYLPGLKMKGLYTQISLVVPFINF